MSTLREALVEIEKILLTGFIGDARKIASEALAKEDEGKEEIVYVEAKDYLTTKDTKGWLNTSRGWLKPIKINLKDDTGKAYKGGEDEFLREMELGLGSAVALLDYVVIPEDCEDPKSIADCKNNIYGTYQILKEKLQSVPLKDGYWKKRCEAAEEILKCVPITGRNQYLMGFGENHKKWKKIIQSKEEAGEE